MKRFKFYMDIWKVNFVGSVVADTIENARAAMLREYKFIPPFVLVEDL